MAEDEKSIPELIREGHVLTYREIGFCAECQPKVAAAFREPAPWPFFRHLLCEACVEEAMKHPVEKCARVHVCSAADNGDTCWFCGCKIGECPGAAQPINTAGLGVTGTDGVDARYLDTGAPGALNPATGQYSSYWVLTEDERRSGFVRPVRTVYFHEKCKTTTKMSQAIAETYAKDPGFYGATFCVQCRDHFPVGAEGEFVWVDGRTGDVTEEKVGT